MTESRLLRGIGVSPGMAWAPALVIRLDFPDVPDRTVEEHDVEGEVERLHAAVRFVAGNLNVLRERVLERAGVEESRIFDAQIMMAQDPDFLAGVEQLIRKNRFAAETAYEFKALELRQMFSGSGSMQLRERLADLNAIQMRMIYRLLGKKDEDPWAIAPDEHAIVVAHELSPGLTVQLDREHVVGLLSEEGTRTAHAAILAHSLGIPAVMGVAGALERVRNGTMILLDGQSGNVLLDPTPEELEAAKTRVSRRQRFEMQLESVVDKPAVTPDRVSIALMGNVDLPDEIDTAVRFGAEGVGLLRTEFLLNGRTAMPTEDEQADYFRRVASAFPHHTVIIRSYDLGGDKFPASFSPPPEPNPFLGWRSIRVCLDHPEFFRDQLRAILRAAYGRDVKLMLPLITSVDEVLRVREMLGEESALLARAGVRAAATVPVGVMIETPAAVVIADRLAEVSDFFSVGTNDLTQYTLAVDRGNARLADRFLPHHPSMVRQLRDILAAGTSAGLPVSVCGEMASEPLDALLLLGLGYRRLSVAPPALPTIKWLVRAVPVSEAAAAASDALGAPHPAGVLDVMRELAGRHADLRLLDPEGNVARPLMGR
ncbi:MAG TPA: phosphoenolpyruvate--protein phosphotransferase [Gemmatimonadales bacterium]|nr:phosphoenolpyruvate--protein phosphotransferase [Gemmatimonadales bacterium]